MKAILFTHSHDDHTGGSRAFPGAALYALNPHRRDGAGQSAWNRIQGGRAGTESGAGGRRELRLLEDGEVLDLHGDRIEVFGIPGHTYDSCAYLAFGGLFMGDSAAGTFNGRMGSAPPFVSVDRKMNQAGLKRLAARLGGRGGEVRYLAFGHQGPIPGLGPLLEWSASH
ncbi:MBL fold metallo-hydrolase [Mesoterricola silvestris]|uniref:Metallo-beta-lactamase domain-containing protein n=1 Tax=Mesoterricola silvestris TaxID=2927979 RepID=A0AA48KCC2_9BACT|nr:MBL fold metallo-hydrolase [Mesoterricola silvestris]BDU73343.1 hypothetical protein METEAL_25170 [Mesoterricola silvestris]